MNGFQSTTINKNVALDYSSKLENLNFKPVFFIISLGMYVNYSCFSLDNDDFSLFTNE